MGRNLLFGTEEGFRLMDDKVADGVVMARILAICERLQLGPQVMDWIKNGIHVEVWATLLSTAEMHLLNIARGLIADPDVLCVHYPRSALSESTANHVWWALRDFVTSRGLERDSDPRAEPWHQRRPCTCIVSGLSPGVSWTCLPDQILQVRDGELGQIFVRAPAQPAS